MDPVSILCPGPSLEGVGSDDISNSLRVAVNSAIYREDLQPDVWCTIAHPKTWAHPLNGLKPWPFESKPTVWGNASAKGEWVLHFPDLDLDLILDEDINACMPWESRMGGWCLYSMFTAMSRLLWCGCTEIHLWGVDQEGDGHAPSCAVPLQDPAVSPKCEPPLQAFSPARWERERKAMAIVMKECEENGIDVIRH